ncbi:GGDEF domain-containing protein [Paenibacillus sp. YN15]|uniref:GGDEF domain-containing protein n=1 Tax=Paenibacillus sp. YN15 TaxID=1742774 RepID=UPI0015EC1CB4|nr:GGDEF domain-containing protein [Paenibacillus sp. YN15]
MNRHGKWYAAGFTVISMLLSLQLEYSVWDFRYSHLLMTGLSLTIIWLLGLGYDRAMNLAVRDDLTRAYNRRFLNHYIPSLLVRAAKKGETLTLTILDCDDFKKINDENGHHTGDTVLQGIARLMIKHIRHEDLLVRLGGDEFVLITRHSTYNSTLTVIDRLRQELDILAREMNLSLSVSAGTAVFPDDGHRLEDLIRMADFRMYQSKLMRKETAAYASLGLSVDQEPRMKQA